MYVAPHTGAWIEILMELQKYTVEIEVAPHTGAWIEIIISPRGLINKGGRAPYGRVD